MPDRFEVAGLVAERLDVGHLDGLCRLDSDPVVMATLGGPRSRETTAEHLRYDLQRWDEHGLGMYALLNGAAELVGRAGLRSTVLLDRPEVEVAYSLRPAWWGKGLATAVVRRLTDLAKAGQVADGLVATVGGRTRRQSGSFRRPGLSCRRRSSERTRRWRCTAVR
jgi:RimJ/RimL family protein N-acetyltransferase